MRKVFVVALREYNAAVRTKAFVIGLVMMPIMMGGSIMLQWLFKDERDKKERAIVVIDRTPGAVLLKRLGQEVESHNDALSDGHSREVWRGPIKMLQQAPPANDTEAASLEEELNTRIRQGKIGGWLMIGPEVLRLAPPTSSATIIFKANRPGDRAIGEQFRKWLTEEVRAIRARELGLSPDKVRDASQPLRFESRFDAAMFVPMGLMFLMFMLILMAATPLMQGVVEEKMQRIAEVLLGSVSPFQLMLGKLIGMTAVSLTISAVYLGGAYWAARHYGFAEAISSDILVWFIVFQTLAALMFGSLFIAVGAACTDMRETQNLLWPVMLLATLPMFFLGPLMNSPNSPVIVGMSYFPFATPSMMIARLGMPDATQWWEPFVGAAVMLLTTLLCVWIAGRIFRVGILLMGKGASLPQIAHWVFRG